MIIKEKNQREGRRLEKLLLLQKLKLSLKGQEQEKLLMNSQKNPAVYYNAQQVQQRRMLHYKETHKIGQKDEEQTQDSTVKRQQRERNKPENSVPLSMSTNGIQLLKRKITPILNLSMK